jgi:AcrR family transcriptional regulator
VDDAPAAAGHRDPKVDPTETDSEAPSRRERMRAATVTEIKQHAWTQVAQGGALAVSLRAIARSMGMTSSALYRYFASHEQLLNELIADGYESLADALERAEAKVPLGTPAGDTFMVVARAYRAWAIRNSTQYALIFGTPMCEPSKAPRVSDEHKRGVNVLFRAMVAGIASGALEPSRVPSPSPSLVKQLKRWQAKMGLPLSVEALAGCMFVWSQLHGAISLEIFEQLPDSLMPAADLFDQQMRVCLSVLGCPTQG